MGVCRQILEGEWAAVPPARAAGARASGDLRCACRHHKLNLLSFLTHITTTLFYLMPRTTPPLPLPVKRALRKLGADIRLARRRRRLPQSLVAERAMISAPTLIKVERGDPGVSMGIYATVLFVLGMAERMGDLADPGDDAWGLAVDEENLPERIHLKSTGGPGPEEGS
jgi:transcriptional regulator with XRE-family HTH domain